MEGFSTCCLMWDQLMCLTTYNLKFELHGIDELNMRYIFPLHCSVHATVCMS